jgi:hypothetical protein
MDLWKEEVHRASMIGHEAYCGSIADYVLRNLRDHLPYLSMHAGFCVVKHAHPELAVHMTSSILKNGPFNYLNETSWDTKRAVKLLCLSENAARFSQNCLIKFRGMERKYIVETVKNIEPGSILGRLMATPESEKQ